MADFVRFVIPGIPKGKATARVTMHGTFIPAESRKEMEAARMIARLAMQGREPFQGPVEMKLCAYCPVPASWSRKKREAALAGDVMPTSKPDLSNIIKGVEDGMRPPAAKRAKPGAKIINALPMKVVYRDDAQIVRMTAWKLYHENPRVVVEIREISA